jgi:hypothetical protein
MPVYNITGAPFSAAVAREPVLRAERMSSGRFQPAVDICWRMAVPSSERCRRLPDVTHNEPNGATLFHIVYNPLK